jgi:hypothetical protein
MVSTTAIRLRILIAAVILGLTVFNLLCFDAAVATTWRAARALKSCFKSAPLGALIKRNALSRCDSRGVGAEFLALRNPPSAGSMPPPLPGRAKRRSV